MVFLKEFFDNVYFEKNQQTTKKHEKLPSMQVVKVCISLKRETKITEKKILKRFLFAISMANLQFMTKKIFRKKSFTSNLETQ